MSIHAIKVYQSEVERIIHFGGTKKETSIRNEFQRLLNEYAKQRGLMLIPEISIKTPKGKTVTPDGKLKDSMRQEAFLEHKLQPHINAGRLDQPATHYLQIFYSDLLSFNS